MCQAHKHECSNCGSCKRKSHPDHEKAMMDPSGNWDDWDGQTEIHEIWVDAEGNVNHVSAGEEAPAGQATEWGVYGHLKEGGVFHIADFPYSEYDGALHLAYGLEKVHHEREELRIAGAYAIRGQA